MRVAVRAKALVVLVPKIYGGDIRCRHRTYTQLVIYFKGRPEAVKISLEMKGQPWLMLQFFIYSGTGQSLTLPAPGVD